MANKTDTHEHIGFLPLSLACKSGNWRRFMSRKKNKAFSKRKKQVLLRDNNACRFCGFELNRFQEVVNIDHNYANNSPSNLATACSFCTQCFFLDSVGLDDKTGGSIIYLPEISQADLNHLCRILFCALDKESAYKSKLQSAYLALKDRYKPVETCFGPGSSDPRSFGQGLIDAGIKEEELNHPLMRDLRLLPQRSAFREQIDYWKQTVFAKVPL